MEYGGVCWPQLQTVSHQITFLRTVWRHNGKSVKNISRIITFPLFTPFFQYQYPKEITMNGGVDFMKGVTDKQRLFWNVFGHFYAILMLCGIRLRRFSLWSTLIFQRCSSYHTTQAVFAPMWPEVTCTIVTPVRCCILGHSCTNVIWGPSVVQQWEPLDTIGAQISNYGTSSSTVAENETDKQTWTSQKVFCTHARAWKTPNQKRMAAWTELKIFQEFCNFQEEVSKQTHSLKWVIQLQINLLHSKKTIK
jgi:hypothetical protein